MPAERNAFRLGLALLLFFSLAIVVIIFLAPTAAGDMLLTVRFPHNQFTTILKTGCEVVCGGQTVGTVRKLELKEMTDPASGYPSLFALITVRVDSSLGLRQDCRIVPEGLLLGGPGKLVVLDRGLGAPVPAGAVIDGQVAVDFAALTRMVAAQLDPKDPASLLAVVQSQLDSSDPKSLLGKIHVSLEDINAVTLSIRNEFDPRQKAVLIAKLHSILDHVNGATRLLRDEVDQTIDKALLAKVHRTLDTLNTGLTTVVAVLDENRQPITETIGHIRSTSEILEKQIAARIAQQLDPAEAASLIAKVHFSLDRLSVSLKDVNVITQAGRETVLLNKDQIGQMIVNLKETSDHLKAASKEIRRNPWRLFYQPTLEEAAQANVFDAARAFSEAATKLDDTLARLQVLSDTPAGSAPGHEKQLAEILEQLKATFAQFNKVEAALWEQLKIK